MSANILFLAVCCSVILMNRDGAPSVDTIIVWIMVGPITGRIDPDLCMRHRISHLHNYRNSADPLDNIPTYRRRHHHHRTGSR